MFLIFPDSASIANYVSAIFVDRIKAKPELVLGLATGSTMEPIYARFVEQARRQQLDVSCLTAFNLDEYVGLESSHPQSYCAYMRHHLYQHLSFDAARLHLPNGLATDLEAHCQHYGESIRQAGGISLQLLGVGSNGHIGFNEPGTPFSSRCHVVELSEETRRDNGRFFDDPSRVPGFAITMGMQDIMDAEEILLIATGENKAPIVAAFYQQGVTEALPMSLLKQHPRTRIMIDEAAASLLPGEVRHEAWAVNG